MYYRGSQIAVIMFDLGSRSSFEAAERWIEDLLKDAQPTMFLVGNKCDLDPVERVISADEGKRLARKHHCQYFETSAQTGAGIPQLFDAVVDAVRRQGSDENATSANNTLPQRDLEEEVGSTSCMWSIFRAWRTRW